MVRDWKKGIKKIRKEIRGKYVVSFGELLIYWSEFIRSQKTKQLPLINYRRERD